MQLSEATGVILGGGKSSRMGFDKALLHVNGHYVVPQTAAKLKKIFPEVVLVADTTKKFSKIEAFQSLPIWTDRYQAAGPLGGLATGLKSAKTPYVFLTACDMPHLSLEGIKRLAEAGQADAQVILYRYQDRLETLFAFYHQSCLATFESQLAAGEGQIRRHFDALNVQVVTVPQDLSLDFSNVNTPADLYRWEEQRMEENKNG
ncbi:molybdenum cofactor guanylyltransferase [Enterococcus hirae]|nr:molybdenum cofactor guanylyltransferase [Enterococcus hirae]